MLNQWTKRLLLIPLAFVLYSCASTSSLQTARTLKKGESQSTAGIGFYSADDFLTEIKTDTDNTAAPIKIDSAPFVELTHREGLGNNWDVGVRATLIGTVGAEAKYQLVDEEKFAMAVGGGLAYITVSSGENETVFIDANVPLYISYDFSELFALYATPRFTYRNVSGSVSGSTSMIGSSVGLKYGKTAGVYLEGTFNKGLSDDYTIAQTNISYFWDTASWF